MNPLDSIADALFNLLGLEGTSLLTVLVAVALVAQLVARLIPDDAGGVLGIVRKIASVLGLYASNRVSSGISLKTIAGAVVNNEIVPTKQTKE